MPNQTAIKFGYPETLVHEYGHWCVLVRPAQVTLGSLVLVCKDVAGRFPDITPTAFSELALVTRDIEAGLMALRPFDKINYLMLMMVDPDVHFHVLPRFEAPQTFDGVEFADAGWPGPPEIAKAVTLEEPVRSRLVEAVRSAWPTTADRP